MDMFRPVWEKHPHAIVYATANFDPGVAPIAVYDENGTPGEIDSDRPGAIFTPSGCLRRLKRCRVLSNSSPHLHPKHGK